jgi:hypothetical protein
VAISAQPDRVLLQKEQSALLLLLALPLKPCIFHGFVVWRGSCYIAAILNKENRNGR